MAKIQVKTKTFNSGIDTSGRNFLPSAYDTQIWRCGIKLETWAEKEGIEGSNIISVSHNHIEVKRGHSFTLLTTVLVTYKVY